jgi:single-stranded-DNA-specific exonuclease
MSQLALGAAPPPPKRPMHAVEPPPSGPRVLPRLELPPYDLSLALALRRELGVGHVLAQVLARRGFTDPAAARAFLDAGDRHDPADFAGIEHAVAAIERHLRAGTRITVHGDYDVDGVCATAVLVRALRALGGDVGWFLPGRIDDGYGLSLETVRRLAERGTELLVTVDCAITAVQEVQAAHDLGLEVVVTDHHTPCPDGRLPACPIVHPAVCGYPCPSLCGTAVAYKLAEALGAPTVAEDLELVALATVADLMPLQGENRRLVREGLHALANTGRPGLRALMEVSRCDPSELDTHALGFRLAPRINAAGRLRRADSGVELLLTADPRRAAEIASELDAVNTERRLVEQRITWEAEAQVAELGERYAYVLWAEDWHPGVIGIVASRIVERHHRPTLLVAADGELATGSGRSIPGFDLLAALHACAGELERYGGHRAAAGVTVRRDRLAALRAAFEAHAAAVLTPDLLEPVERVDAVVSGAELGLELAEELAALEPCGLGNPRCRLLVPGARFEDIRTMGEGKHARFAVVSGGARARAVAFGCDGDPGAPAGQPVDATFRLERNCWNGVVEPRLVLGHSRACRRGPISVVGEAEHYFAGVLAELDASLETAGGPDAPGGARLILDRRGQSPLAALADALATGDPVLAVCADVSRRLPGLAARTGGFALASYHALERAPGLASGYIQIVALDPPAGPQAAAILQAGAGYAHLSWSEPELRFAEQMHELEYGLRTWLATLYRAIRTRARVTGEELERLLRGDARQPRPARIGGRLIRVLAELELVSLDRELPALALAGTAQTALERSAAYRVYSKRLEDGRRYLSSLDQLVPS